ncbi:hypothetical protein RHSIM_Rhsim02G0024400 [Rhododendron simsii]|uniref:Uncharacterized protein n=1 Tax=Rhododendron simsii TaxID=118357 RepID=A0A834LZ09_RHOSS|nr:hypothetical protein RHSIM_Rhsim02G0024400 [Rhododendron simsii]
MLTQQATNSDQIVKIVNLPTSDHKVEYVNVQEKAEALYDVIATELAQHAASCIFAVKSISDPIDAHEPLQLEAAQPQPPIPHIGAAACVLEQ